MEQIIVFLLYIPLKGLTYKCEVRTLENQMENCTNKHKNSKSKEYTIHVI